MYIDCQTQSPISSSGLWLQSNPFKAMIPLLMLEIILIVAISKLMHFFVLRRLQQPAMVSQILTGIILGPTVIGRIKGFRQSIFPRHSIRMIPLKTFSMVSNSVFFLMVGVKTDPSMLWRSGKKALVIGIASNIFPMIISQLWKLHLGEGLPKDLQNGNGTIDAVILTWSYSSYVVISDLLAELKLLNSKVGRLAISTTLVSEVFGLITMRCFKSFLIGKETGNKWLGFGSLASFVTLVTTAFFIARPLVMWATRRTPAGQLLLNEAHFFLVVMLCLTFGLVSEVVGHNMEVGMFVLGLALPSGPPLGTTLTEKLGPIVLQLGIPVFVAIGGIRSSLHLIVPGASSFTLIALVFFVHFFKFASVSIPMFFFDVDFRDAIVLALIMSYKGIFEIGSFNIMLNNHLATRQTYSLMIVYILMQAAILVPMIRALYNPNSHRYKTNDKRRTIQHANYNMELKILTSIHGQDEVSSILDLLDSIHSTCMCIYALHLVELTGQAASILVPYNNKHRDPSYAAKSSTIFNAFRYLETKKKGQISVHPFISISPCNSMHVDICSLAMDKRVSMVILPFHKTRAIDGTLEYTSNEHRSINANALNYAPCSIGILVNNGSQVMNNVVMYFIGGPDDREAVSLAMLMVGSPQIRLSIVRFLPPKEWRNECEDRLDEEVLEKLGCEDLAALYTEEHVRDAEEMIDVICSMSTASDLLIVGRQEGHESYLTQGLSTWNNYPELGVIGDILTPKDLRSRASILVVQQHKGAS